MDVFGWEVSALARRVAIYHATATCITSHEHALYVSTHSHTHVPGGSGLGSHFARRSTGRASCGTPERLRLSFHLPRYATACSAAQTILHLPQRSRASIHQALGVRAWILWAHFSVVTSKHIDLRSCRGERRRAMHRLQVEICSRLH